jgi:hypothetical protein
MKAGVESAARAEGIAAADELQVHEISLPRHSGRATGTSRLRNVASGGQAVRDLYHNAQNSDGTGPVWPTPCLFIVFLTLPRSSSGL